MGKHVAGDAPEMDRLVDEASAAIGAAIDALRVPRLMGVVLGGGYGRGEGGVMATGGAQTLSNDLDFYVVAEDGSSADDISAIGRALAPISAEWTRKLGVDADFCTPKTPWRLRHDQERVMIQELVHGYFDVAGAKGETLFAGVDRRGPEEFPWMEAARLMMNRGAGLMLALASGDNRFVARNINKAVLGAGDARLISRGGYKWKAIERAQALGDRLYGAAVAWKFRPRAEAVCGWDEARDTWLAALEEVMAAGRPRRNMYSAARWLARRKSLGDPATFGLDPVVRVLKRVESGVRARRTMSASLRRDWEIFN